MSTTLPSYSQKASNSLFDYCTIPERLKKIAKTTPDKNAFVFLSSNAQRLSVITCKELYDRANEFARGIINLGIKKGDVVSIGLPNIPEWLICTFGAMIAGAIPMNIVFYHKDGSDVVSLCNSVKASCIVFHPGHKSKHMDILQHVIDESDSNGQVKSKKLPSLKYAICTVEGPSKVNFMMFSDLIELGKQSLKVSLPCLDVDDVALFMLTSGSTNIPKIIPWSHFSVFNTSKSFIDIYGSDGASVYFNDRPFNWVGGWPFYFLLTGCTRVTLTDVLGMKSPQSIAEFNVKAIEDENCTLALIILPCLHIFLQGNIPLGSKWPIQVVASGGLPMSTVFTKAIGPIAKKLVNIYGCSEVGFMALNQITDPSSFINFSVGNVLAGGEMKMVDENGRIVPRGEQGEIYFRSAIRSRGYIGGLNETNAAVTEAGWYKTDDVGVMCKNGSIVVNGRKSDVINVSGWKIIPSYLQGVLRKHPEVHDVVIVPVPDDILVDVACACVMPRPGSIVTKQDLHDYVLQQYSLDGDTYGAQLIVPKYVVIMNVLPRTPVGKIDQKSVKATVYAELGIQTKQ